MVALGALALSAGALGLASTTGCGNACTEIGCVVAPAVELTGDAGDPPSGEYRVLLVADGDDFICSTSWPKGASEGCVGANGEPTNRFFIDQSDWLSGIAVGMRGQPAMLTVTVELDGNEVASTAELLEYQTSYPNGKGCGECRDPGTIRIQLEASADIAAGGGGVGGAGGASDGGGGVGGSA